jgi:hypothetical protein
VQIASAATPLPEYLYEDAARALPFDISRETLRDIDAPEKARRVFREALDTLTDTDKRDPYVLNALVSLAEECARYGGERDAESVALDMLDSAARYGVELPRSPRPGITVLSDDVSSFESVIDESPQRKLQLIYIDTPFATLRLDAEDAANRGKISLRNLSAPQAPKKATALGVALRFWSIWVTFAILILSVIIEQLRKRSAMRWIVPSVAVALFTVNLLVVVTTAEPETLLEMDAVEIKMSDGEAAILSFPLSDDRDRDLTVTDEDEVPMPSRYNAVTHAIEARIKTGGKYYLRLSAVYFTDIKEKSAETQHAVRALTSRGLMAGADERSFLPDREITRAEFLSVVLRVMDLLDEEAECRFPDVLKSDWFYTVAASAEKERIINGFEDGTFRGNSAITKAEMVSIAGNSLTRMMSYRAPDDVEAVLSAYTDGDEIANWARGNVALATWAGIVPLRADGSFDGGGVMTRGDAAIMLYRLFMRIW